MADRELGHELDILEPMEVEETVVKEEEAAKSLRFKSITDDIITKKYQEWRKQNRTPKEIKKDIEKAVDFVNTIPDGEVKEEVNKHILLLTSEYVFMETGTLDSAQIIGNRAIKLNESMKNGVDLNSKLIMAQLSKEIKDNDIKRAQPVGFDDQDSFVAEVDNEIGEEEMNVEPVAEDNVVEDAAPEVDIYANNVEENNQDLINEDSAVEETVATEEVESNIEEPVIETEEPEFNNEEVEAPVESSEEVSSDNNVEEEAVEEDVPIEDDVAAVIDGDVEPEEAVEPVVENEEAVTEATEVVVNVDKNFVDEKLKVMQDAMKEYYDELDRSQAINAKIEAAKEEDRVKAEEVENAKKENELKEAEINELIEAILKDKEDLALQNQQMEKECEEIFERNKKHDEDLKMYRSKMTSYDEIINSSKEYTEKKRSM